MQGPDWEGLGSPAQDGALSSVNGALRGCPEVCSRRRTFCGWLLGQVSPGREGAARAGQGDAAGGGPRNPGRSDRGTASSERAWAGRVGPGGQGSGLRPRPLTVQPGVGGERLQGGAQDARTSEVSVPKEQRLEEAGDHQGHTASPGQAGRGDPGLPTFAWTSWLRLIVTPHFSPSPPSCPSLASLPSCPHKGWSLQHQHSPPGPSEQRCGLSCGCPSSQGLVTSGRHPGTALTRPLGAPRHEGLLTIIEWHPWARTAHTTGSWDPDHEPEKCCVDPTLQVKG